MKDSSMRFITRGNIKWTKPTSGSKLITFFFISLKKKLVHFFTLLYYWLLITWPHWSINIYNVYTLHLHSVLNIVFLSSPINYLLSGIFL